MISGPAFSALATASALIGDVSMATEAINHAIQAENVEQNGYLHSRSSLPLFLKLRKQEVERECQRVRDFLKSGKGQEKEIIVW